MHDIDPKFFNEDGSLNVEAASAAGRKAQARTAAAGAGEITAAAKQLISAAVNAFADKASTRNG